MRKVNNNPSFPEIEKELIEFWEKNEIFQKSLSRATQKKEYIFYDGPPFATGLPHYGHLLAGTIKDVIGRYFTMKGCLLYTSPSPRDATLSRMPSSA